MSCLVGISRGCRCRGIDWDIAASAMFVMARSEKNILRRKLWRLLRLWVTAKRHLKPIEMTFSHRDVTRLILPWLMFCGVILTPPFLLSGEGLVKVGERVRRSVDLATYLRTFFVYRVWTDRFTRDDYIHLVSVFCAGSIRSRK